MKLAAHGNGPGIGFGSQSMEQLVQGARQASKREGGLGNQRFSVSIARSSSTPHQND